MMHHGDADTASPARRPARVSGRDCQLAALKQTTAAAQFKPATLETGLKITVPPFVKVGEILQIDTREGKYLSRAK